MRTASREHGAASERRLRHIVVLAVGMLALLASRAAFGATFTFDDVEFWIGSGSNRAALVIDWADTSDDPPALVWGFRWNGEASGFDMLSAVLAADDRLFAKLGQGTTGPNAVYGVGYDADDDGQFGVSDGTTFDAHGIAFTDSSDGEVATDEADYYAEGWLGGFWHYGVAAINPYDDGTWEDTLVGMAERTLTDGAWDSWTFSPEFDFSAFAVNPQPGASPFADGDFNRDGDVDAADYFRWKELYGTHDSAADGNRNGIVDAADYSVWRNHIGSNTLAQGVAHVSVPEPQISMWCVLFFVVLFRKRKH